MKSKKILFCSLLLLAAELSGATSLKAFEGSFPPAHPGKFIKALGKGETRPEGLSKKSEIDYGIQLTFTGLDKWYTDWSPDGQLIAFEQNGDIWIIPSEGGEPVNLTAEIEGYCYNPFFALGPKPGVAFTRYDDTTENYYIEVINLNGINHQVLIEDALAGSWSHNGKYIVYRIASTSELALYDLGNGSVTVLGFGDYGYGYSCFSPDDMYVITSLIVEDGTAKLFRIPIEGGKPEQLTFHEGNHWYPEYSPDGKWILYTNSDFGMLYAYSTETGDSMPVFPDPTILNFMGNFSPEGDRICYLLDVEGINEVFIADFPFGEEKPSFFTLGSSMDEVIAAQGEPTEVNEHVNINRIVWKYGVSTVTFSYDQKVVIGYVISPQGDVLNVYLGDSEPGAMFAMGSTEYGVIAAQGTPTAVIVNEAKNKIVWFYHKSIVVFSFDGRFVFEYYESPEGDSLNIEPYTTPATAYVNVDAPIGGEVLEPGTFYNIYWSHVDLRSVRIEFSSDGGKSWSILSTNFDAAMGLYVWKVPEIESSMCLVRISDGDNNAVRDVSDNFFSITSVVEEPYIEVISPNGGEEWEAGSMQMIMWKSQDVRELTIEYSVDGGNTYIPVETVIIDDTSMNTHSYQWVVPDEPSTECLVSIYSEADDTVYGESYDFFTIISVGEEPFIDVIIPDGGEEWEVGSTHEIMWKSSGIEYVNIYYSPNIEEIELIKIALDVDASLQSFLWTVPDNPTASCIIVIADASRPGEIFDISFETFSIIPAGVEPYIVVLAPDGGERWGVGTVQEIVWESSGVNSVTIMYSTDGGTEWGLVVENYIVNVTDVVPAEISYSWEVPDTPSSTCLVGILDASNTEILDISDNPFTIIPAGIQPELIFSYQTDDAIYLSSPSIANDGTIYIGSLDNYLYAINSDGTLKWRSDLGGAIWSSPAIGIDGTVYIGVINGRLYAVNNDGTPLWYYQAAGAIFSSPAIRGDETIYFGDTDNNFYALNSDGTLKWQKKLNAVIYSSPAIGIDGTIYIGDMEGSLYAFSPDGVQKWSFRTDGSIFGSPAIGGDGTVYIGTTEDGKLYAVNPNGSLKWKQLLGIHVESSPAIGPDGTIYVGSEGPGDLFALNPVDGSILWSYPTGGNIVSSPAVGSDGTIYVGSDDWSLHAVSPDGQPKWSYPTFGEIWSSPVINNKGKIYIGSYDGALYSIDSMTNAGLASSPWPKYRHDRKNTGRFFDVSKPFVLVKTPDGGENLLPSTDYTITWSSRNVSTVRIEYSLDNGISWIEIIGEVQASDDSYTWLIPDDIDSSECRIRITDTSDNNITDISNNSFTISPESFIEVSSPNGGEKFNVGSTETIFWDSYGVAQINIQYSIDGGTNWTTIASNVDASVGSFTWTIPDNLSTDCKIRLTDSANSDIVDESDGTFSIISSKFIRITSPKFGDRWTVNSEKEIKWEFSGVANVKIELSIDDGVTWTELAGSVSASTGSYGLVVPDTPSNQCLIRISDVSDPTITITSSRFEFIRPELIIVHNLIDVAQENQEITFTADVTSESDIENVVLHYDVTGDRVFDNLISLQSAGGSTYSVTLGVGIFTALGMEYYITTRDADNNKSRSPADVGFYSIKALIPDIKSTEQTKGGSVQNAYRMVSIPLNLTQTKIEEQMRGILPSGDTGTDWRLFRFSPGSSTPQEYPDIESFSPGKAFWLITKNDFRLEASEGTTVTTSEPFNITLKAGWNDIANPWMFNISWDDIENPSGANLSALYTYEGSWSDPDSIHVLDPWKGYCVNNLENRNVIIKFNPKPAGNANKYVAKNEQNPESNPGGNALDNEQIMWMLTVKASAGEASDIANHFGLRHGAMEEWDKYDHVEPPPVGDYVSVAFPHYDWEKYPYAYTVDFRPPSSKNLSWDFDVTTNISGEKVTVELAGIESLPEGYGVILFDRDSNHRIDVKNESFSFISGDDITKRHFTIKIDNSMGEDHEHYTVRPERFLTAQCYPNPFNPSTTIRYELSQPGHVVITVFNSLGQRVRRYDLGSKDHGIHDFVFDASGMTSGLYFYHVDSGYASVTNKMLFMK